MEEIRSLSEFRIRLERLLTESGVKSKLSTFDYLSLEVQISGLALDYADGFYRDALRLKS